MKALRRFEKAPRAAHIEEVPTPKPGPEQILLKVDHCGICGSDLHAFLNHAGYESVLERVTFGHEVSGTIESIGSNVKDWALGDRGVLTAIQYTNPQCPYVLAGDPQLSPTRRVQGLHLNGGMAEYIAVDQQFLNPIPDTLDLRDAALTEPLSVADHCVVNRSSIGPDDQVIVSGPGIIGMLCAIVARHIGAEVLISGTSADEEVRLSTARKIGFETVIVGPDLPPLHEQVMAHFGKEADAFLEASGASPALSASWQAVRTDGTVTVVALYGQETKLDDTQFVRKQIDVRTSYGSATPSYHRAIELLNNGIIPVEKLVKVYDLEDGINAFEEAERQEVLKPLLKC